VAELLERARALYTNAHAADGVGRFADALTGYRAVVTLLEGTELDGVARDGSVLLVRAWLGMARGTYEATGDKAAAFALLDAAEQRCERDGLADELLAVRGQRGLLLLRSGEVDEALRELDKVAPGPDAEPTVDLGIVMLNRGALHLELGQSGAAATDLRMAAEFGRRLGHATLEASARHNLGYAAFLQGDLPLALNEMSEAQGAMDESVTYLDRGRVLAEAGLVSDAVAALSAAAEHVVHDSALVHAEAQLELSRCLLDLQRFEAAQQAAREAAKAFTRAGNRLWQARARMAELEAQLAADRWTQNRAPRTTLRRRAARALELAESGEAGGVAWRMVVTYPALLAAAEWEVLAGDVAAAGAHLHRVPADLAAAPLSLRLARSAVVARIAFMSGRRAAGVRAVRHGQRTLAEHRGLGSVEAIAAAGVHALQLNLVDAQAAFASGDPAALFDALERGRATAAGPGRLVPPEDARLASLLEQARAEHQAALALGPTESPEGIRAKRRHLLQARRLQEEARERSWRVEGERRPVEPTTARAVRAMLRDTAATGAVVASYVTMTGHVMAVRVDAHGETLHRLASREDVVELTNRARADFAVVANSLIPSALRTAAASSLRRTLTHLDDLLVAPLDATGDLHVAARGRMLTLPWAALPSRSGLRTWVADRVDLRPGLAATGTARPGGVVVLAGPGTAGGVDEARAVAGVWPDVRLLTGDAATTAAAVGSLASAALVHLAAHGVHAQDNALFSSLRLADGPLFAHELDGVDLAGAVVVLSACELGLSTSDVGGEALGFASVLLRHGARAVIAAVSPLRDDVAVRIMPRLHAALRDGRPPGAALAAATVDEPEPVPLVCFGPIAV
jgi:tetratricopeptide (TPR) repeat protein